MTSSPLPSWYTRRMGVLGAAGVALLGLVFFPAGATAQGNGGSNGGGGGSVVFVDGGGGASSSNYVDSAGLVADSLSALADSVKAAGQASGQEASGQEASGGKKKARLRSLSEALARRAADSTKAKSSEK